MATLTDISKIDNAVRLYKDAQSMYFALGGSRTEWPSSTPPLPVSSQQVVPELIGLKKVTKVSMAVKTSVASGTNIVSYGGTNFELVGLADAYTKKATYVYISSSIVSADFEEPIYRIVALTSNPTFSTGVIGDAVPAKLVKNQGRLQAIDNVTAIDRSAIDINEFVIIQG